MFSFFTRNKKKVDVNSNNLNSQQSSSIFTPFFQVTTSVVPNVAVNQSASCHNDANKYEQTQKVDSAPFVPPATQSRSLEEVSTSQHSSNDADIQCSIATNSTIVSSATRTNVATTPNPSAGGVVDDVVTDDGIGNGIVKMCKNNTFFDIESRITKPTRSTVNDDQRSCVSSKTTATTDAVSSDWNSSVQFENETTGANHQSADSANASSSACKVPTSLISVPTSVSANSNASNNSPNLKVKHRDNVYVNVVNDAAAQLSANKMSNVKPAGHGTVAISPRIPTPNASRRNSAVTPSQTPPESPRIVEVYDDCNGFPLFPIANGRANSVQVSKSIPEAPPRLRGRQQEPVMGQHEQDEKYTKKNLVNQEATFQSQLNDLSKQLAVRDAEANKLRFQMDELQRDVFAKSAGMDRLQAELQAAHKESDHVKQRIKNLEHDLQEYREKNGNLSEEIAKKTENFAESESYASNKLSELESVIRELREKILSLEAQIVELQTEKAALVAQHASILQERDSEKKNVEQKLEEAIKQKNLVAAKWQTEFEKLRTVSLLKEQSMLDDFEWKLRDVHKTCKSRLVEKEKCLEQRLKEAYRDAEVKLHIAQEMMNEVQHLKECKNEVISLKDKSEEHQTAMKLMLEKQDDMKSTELSLQNEAKKLRSLIDLEQENLQHMQRVHQQELMDKERWLQNTLQEKKTEIAEYWEERLLHEIGRLKWELEQLYLEEKQDAIEDLKTNKEQEFEEAKKNWERKINECFKEIKDLKKILDEKESYYQNELVAQQTNSDREIFEFRRIMDKIDNAHHERFEKLSLDHELEIEKLSVQHNDKLAEMEMSHRNQTSTLRASLILLRDQMEKEAQQQINELIAQHRSQLDTQWANLVHQKSEAIKLLEQDYVNKIKTLEELFYTQQKSHEAREVELLKTIDSLKNEAVSKNLTIDDMQSNVDTLEGGVQVLNQEIAQQSDQLMKNRRDADQKIRGLQDVLMKLQALADQERDEFQTKLTHQQKQSQQQVEHLQKKVITLTKLFEEIRARHERRESRQEDLNLISDLRQMIAEQEKDLTCINEEKRYYQIQLMNLQRESDASYEDGEEEFIDSEDFQKVPDGYTVTFPGEPQPQITAPPAPRPKLSGGTINLAIPPTIPECDDCEEES